MNVALMNKRRAYSMAVRGERAAATRQRILDAAREQFDLRSADFTLDTVASTAGVSVQTVLRAFGSKHGLVLAAIGTDRSEVPHIAELPVSIGEAVALVVDDYERIGDRVIWMLAAEHRIAGFTEIADEGRRRHRDWVEAVFADDLASLDPAHRDEMLAALLVAVDVSTWKLLRRDLGLDRESTESTIERLVRGALTDKGE